MAEKETTDGLKFAFLRERATERLLRWLAENEPARRQVRTMLRSTWECTGGKDGIPIPATTVARMTIISNVYPLGSVAGPRLELGVMFLEFGLQLVDWDRVVESIRRDDLNEG